MLAAERREQGVGATALQEEQATLVQRPLSAALRNPGVAAAVAWRQPRMSTSAVR